MLLQLYVLADRFSIENLKNDCIDLVVQIANSEFCFTGLDIAYVYQNTNATSPLRRAVVKLVGFHVKYSGLLSGALGNGIMRLVGRNAEFAVDVVSVLGEIHEDLGDVRDEKGCEWHEHRDGHGCEDVW